jgi:hypothetical protein
VKLVDTPVLGTGALKKRASSSLVPGTIFSKGKISMIQPVCSSLALDFPPPFMQEFEKETDSLIKDWPKNLYLIKFDPNLFCCHQIVSRELNSPPLVTQSLVGHKSKESAKAYLLNNKNLPKNPNIILVNLEEAEEIAKKKDLDAIALFDGPFLLEIKFLR